MTLRSRLASVERPQPTPGAAVPAPAPPAPPAGPAMPEPAAPPAPGGLSREDYARLRRWLLGKMAGGLEGYTDLKRSPSVMQMLRERFAPLYAQAGVKLPEADVERLFREVTDEIVGYGPIEVLLNDSTVSEVMVNGPRQVYVERKGKLMLSDVTFEDNDHVLRIVDRIIRPLGRRVDSKTPTVDARLPDGSRVNAVIPPVAIDGPSITIRKFGTKKLTIQDLIDFGSMTPQIAEFLEACVVARLNVVVSGGTGSGKTTLLNVLSSFIPEDERIVTIEDAAELQLGQPHIVRLESKPPDIDGTGAVTIRDLVKNSLRMRPERIVIGECRSGEALDMLQAMNTGHDGSLTTLHSNNPREAIARLETMCLMAGLEFPLKVIREQIAHAVDLIVQQSRLKDGSRKITYVTEVNGMEGESVVLTDIFTFKDEGLDQDGKVIGQVKPTGLRPMCTPRLEAAGFKLPPEVFGASVQDILGRPGPRRK